MTTARRAKPLYRSTNDPWGIASALWATGLAAYLLEDPNADAFVEESRQLFRELGDTSGIAQACNLAGLIAATRGDDTTAAALSV